MPFLCTLNHRYWCLAALVLVSQTVASAEPRQSLAEKRLGIIKGTTPGIVLFDFGTPTVPAVSAPASSPVAAATNSRASVDAKAATEDKTSTRAAIEQPAASRFFGALPAPSGRSLQSARRLDAADQGIPLPTARTASQPQAEPAAKR